MVNRSSRSSKLFPDSFCYVCGYYISPTQTKHKVVSGTKFFTAYHAYFGMAIGDQDKSKAPTTVVAAADQLWKDGYVEPESQCSLLFQEYGENQ